MAVHLKWKHLRNVRNCELLVLSIKGLSVCHVCLWSVSMLSFARRLVCSNWQLRLKGTFTQFRCVKKTEKEFLFGAKKPLFLGMYGLCFLSETHWEIVICFIFMLLYFLFLIQSPHNRYNSKFSSWLKFFFAFTREVMVLLV